MAVYKRKDSAFWWVEFSRGGTRYRFSAGTTSKREALQVERDTKRDIEQQLKSGRRTMRLSEVAQAYYDLRRLGHGKDKSAMHDAHIVQDILIHFGDIDIDQITTPDATAWITAMLKRGLKGSTVNRRTSILRAMLHFAKDELHALDVVPRVQVMRETPTEPRFLSDEEIERLIAASPVHLARLLRFLADTGCRTAEATGLTWGDVRLQDDTPSVTLRASRTKSSKGRSVPLTRRATEMLREMYREAQDRQGQVCPLEVGAGEAGRVFTWTNDGGAMAPYVGLYSGRVNTTPQ